MKRVKGGLWVRQVRTGQDWDIKNGYMEPGSGTLLHDHECASDNLARHCVVRFKQLADGTG
ncbi:hypothetical protein [Marivita sp.]|uniref:hypothetical protein n=1 Tax=Marivita sp. TaxID=2003365 RepID=UPI003B521A46